MFMDLLPILRTVSAAAFVFYGVVCLVSPAMVVEFERYRLPRMRVLTAALEILGALGLLLGPTPIWIAAAAAGLCALMISALVVRALIGDAWHRSLPAFVLFVVNAWIAAEMWTRG
jgi:uncharacterized membrane protein